MLKSTFFKKTKRFCIPNSKFAQKPPKKPPFWRFGDFCSEGLRLLNIRDLFLDSNLSLVTFICLWINFREITMQIFFSIFRKENVSKQEWLVVYVSRNLHLLKEAGKCWAVIILRKIVLQWVNLQRF